MHRAVYRTGGYPISFVWGVSQSSLFSCSFHQAAVQLHAIRAKLRTATAKDVEVQTCERSFCRLESNLMQSFYLFLSPFSGLLDNLFLFFKLEPLSPLVCFATSALQAYAKINYDELLSCLPEDLIFQVWHPASSFRIYIYIYLYIWACNVSNQGW